MTEKSKALAPIDQIRKELFELENQFKMVLPPQVAPERFIRVTLTAIQKNQDLLAADKKSLFGACMAAATDGLIPDGREGAIVVYKTKDKSTGQYIPTAQWLPMVSGILKKVRNSGELASITSQVIHEKDKFRYWVDSDGEHLEHEPLLFGERGLAVGVYAIAKTKNGDIYIEPMTIEQVEQVRNVSRAKDSGPWKDWWNEMARKTAIRRLSKRLPMSTDLETLIQRDDDHYDFDKPQQERVPYVAPIYVPGIEPRVTMEQLVSENKETHDAKEFFKMVGGQLLKHSGQDWVDKLREEMQKQGVQFEETPNE